MLIAPLLSLLRSGSKAALLTLAALVLAVFVATAYAKLKDAPAGAAPQAVAINPITNKIYRHHSNVINSNRATGIGTTRVGSRPAAIVVNPVGQSLG